MAESAPEHGAWDHGQMDIREQRETFSAFIKLSKWGSLAIAVGVLFFSMLFSTEAGFMASAAAAVVVLVVGVLILKEKPRGPEAH